MGNPEQSELKQHERLVRDVLPDLRNRLTQAEQALAQQDSASSQGLLAHAGEVRDSGAVYFWTWGRILLTRLHPVPPPALSPPRT